MARFLALAPSPLCHFIFLVSVKGGVLMADSSAASDEPPLGLSALKLALALLDQASTYAPSWAYPPPPSSSNQVDAVPALKSVWSSLKWL